MMLSGGGTDDNVSTRPTFTINGQSLTWVTEFTYLGVKKKTFYNFHSLFSRAEMAAANTADDTVACFYGFFKAS